MDMGTGTGWSLRQAWTAAGRVRLEPLAYQVLATARPRSVLGLVRSRAPLTLQLFLASRDGLLAELGNGFAMLRRPAIGPHVPAGGWMLRLSRRLDRHWDFACFAGPPLLLLLAGVASVPADRAVAIAAVLLALLWVSVFMSGMMIWQLRWVARMGAPSPPGGERAAESLPGCHWSVPLFHQPDPSRAEELAQRLTQQLAGLIRADLQGAATHTARVGRLDLTETLVVLVNGISTAEARTVLAQSVRAVGGYPAGSEVVLLAPPGRLDQVPVHRIAGGGFLLLYLTGLGVALAACAAFVASNEAAACGAASCAGRPALYSTAVRWLLQRLLFSDPPGLAPGTLRDTVLGWLISAASLMLIVVAVVAARQEIARNRQARLEHARVISEVTAAGRVLVLVATERERDAVLAAAHDLSATRAVTDTSGDRVIYRLGRVNGTEVALARAGEQGPALPAGMAQTARSAIRRFGPDYVILTGICYGLRPDEGQQLGDVVVARRVHHIDPRKVTEDGVIPRGVNANCSPRLLDRFHDAQLTWTMARVHTGTVLCSSMLVNSRAVVTGLREDYPDAIAGEMEGVAVFEAAAEDPKPDWIMVKAISDWGYGKDDTAQVMAARNAAGLVLHVIAHGNLRRWQHHPESPSPQA